MIKELAKIDRDPAIGFAALLGERVWRQLPGRVRARFGAPLDVCDAHMYGGVVVEVRRSFAGWVLAQLARLIGGAVPLRTDTGTPASVIVTRVSGAADQHWTRVYGRRDGNPQVVHSVKRFAGRTGLEELLGGGLSMALDVRGNPDGLKFVSSHFLLRTLNMEVELPRWLVPLDISVEHSDIGDGQFWFVLRVEMRGLGEVFYQRARFADVQRAEQSERRPLPRLVA